MRDEYYYEYGIYDFSAKDLMLNDWIVSDFQKPGKVTKIRTGKEGNFVEMQYKDNSNTILCRETFFSPIPICKETLELNNDELGSDAFTWQFDRKGVFFSIHATSGEHDLSFTGYLKYVHELQHVLRLCGHEEFADNFKIVY